MKYLDRILIAEDEASIRTLYAYCSKKAGLNADLVLNGKEALDLVEQNRQQGLSYPVFVTDSKMPILSGPELVMELFQKRNEGLILPYEIFMVSGFSDVGFQELNGYGLKKFYEKPIDLSDFTRTLKQVYEDVLKQGTDTAI